MKTLKYIAAIATMLYATNAGAQTNESKYVSYWTHFKDMQPEGIASLVVDRGSNTVVGVFGLDNALDDGIDSIVFFPSPSLGVPNTAYHTPEVKAELVERSRDIILSEMPMPVAVSEGSPTPIIPPPVDKTVSTYRTNMPAEVAQTLTGLRNNIIDQMDYITSSLAKQTKARLFSGFPGQIITGSEQDFIDDSITLQLSDIEYCGQGFHYRANTLWRVNGPGYSLEVEQADYVPECSIDGKRPIKIRLESKGTADREAFYATIDISSETSRMRERADALATQVMNTYDTLQDVVTVDAMKDVLK